MTEAPASAPLPEIVVDARGHHCPVPTLRLRRALERAGGARVVLLADDPMARIDVPHFCQQARMSLVSVEDAAPGWRFTIQPD